jgi:putative DNA primase/helicase
LSITNTTLERFPHHTENVPEELKEGECWVTCDEHKVPLIPIPNGALFAASSTDPSTWRTYETTLETWRENEHVAGVGRVIGADEPYVGVDFDDVVDQDTGEISPWAQSIIERLDSYAEISPSRTGVKIWVRAPGLSRAYK